MLNVSKDKIKHRLEKITFNISNQKYVKSYSKIKFWRKQLFKKISWHFVGLILMSDFQTLVKLLKKTIGSLHLVLEPMLAIPFLTSEQYYSAAYMQEPLYSLKRSLYEKYVL